MEQREHAAEHGRGGASLFSLQKSLDDKELDTESRKQVTDLVQQAFDKTAHIEIRAPGGGRIRIDDTMDAGNAPLSSPIHVTVGSHAITVTVGEQTERMTVECQAGKVTPADFASKFPNAPGGGPETPGGETFRPMAGWVVPTVVGVAGLAGLGLGVGFAMASQSDQSTASSLYARGVCANTSTAACASYKNAIDSQNTDSTISIVGYVGGGVLLATAAVLFIAWPKATREVTVAPSVSPSSAGLTLFGRF